MGYLSKIGHGMYIEVNGNSFWDIIHLERYEYSGGTLSRAGYGPMYEISGNIIRKTFGGPILEISGSIIRQTFGGPIAEISGNMIRMMYGSYEYECVGVNDEQLICLIAILFGGDL